LPIFCYPNGDHDSTVMTILREEGILIGLSTLVGENELDSTDLLRLRRIGITPRSSLPIFSLRLLRPGMYLDTWRYRRMRQLPKEGVSPIQPMLSKEGSHQVQNTRSSKNPASRRIAYIVSAFPVLTETFILYELSPWRCWACP